MKELLEISNALQQLGDSPAAIATVIHVEGSSYRKPGARMLLTPQGHSWGMVSGGCLESDVLDHARRALLSHQPRTVRYDSTSEEDVIFGTGLGCNGVLDVLIEPVTPDFRRCFISAVQNSYRTRTIGGVASRVGDAGESEFEPEHAFFTAGGWTGSHGLTETLNVHLLQPAITGLWNAGEGSPMFVQALIPPVHLLIFGGWMDVIPLTRMAKEVGFCVTVIDARQRMSSRRLFHAADSVLLCSATEACAKIRPDDRTVAMVMNHHLERDRETLAALSSYQLPYVGVLGPKRRRDRMVQGLKECGNSIPEPFEESLHGPAGLDIGAQTPEEIALSILSEILSMVRGGSGKPIRERETAPLASLS